MCLLSKDMLKSSSPIMIMWHYFWKTSLDKVRYIERLRALYSISHVNEEWSTQEGELLQMTGAMIHKPNMSKTAIKSVEPKKWWGFLYKFQRVWHFWHFDPDYCLYNCDLKKATQVWILCYDSQVQFYYKRILVQLNLVE